MKTDPWTLADQEQAEVLAAESEGDDHTDCECTGADPFGLLAPDDPMPGPNGCVCGYNGDCNCPFVSESDAEQVSDPGYAFGPPRAG